MDEVINVAVKLALSCYYGSIIILAVVGNIILITTICTRKAMRTSINYLILSIAFSDILFTLFSVLTRLIYLFNEQLIVGNFSCKLTHMAYLVTITVTQMTFVAISIVSLQLIMCPTQEPLTKRGGIIIAIVIWVVNFVISLPDSIQPTALSGLNLFYDYNLPDPRYIKTFDLFYIKFFAMWSYFIPTVWLIIAYSIILWKLYTLYSPTGPMDDSFDEIDVNRKMVIMMVVTTAMHLVCYSALAVLLLDINVLSHLRASSIIVVLAHGVAIISTVGKPIIYFLMSDKFQSNIKDMFLCRSQDLEDENMHLI